MEFTVTIKDQDVLDGITWAREQYNSGLTDLEYAKSAVTSTLENCAQQKLRIEGRAKIESDAVALTAKIDAARSK